LLDKTTSADGAYDFRDKDNGHIRRKWCWRKEGKGEREERGEEEGRGTVEGKGTGKVQEGGWVRSMEWQGNGAGKGKRDRGGGYGRGGEERAMKGMFSALLFLPMQTVHIRSPGGSLKTIALKI